MFGIGGFELFLILLFGFIIFGPDHLPRIANTVGKVISRFRNAQSEMNRVIQDEVYDPNSDEPFKNPMDAIANRSKNEDQKNEAEQESFSARKARYDRERAAKQAAEQSSDEHETLKAADEATDTSAVSPSGEEAIEEVEAPGTSDAVEAESTVAPATKKEVVDTTQDKPASNPRPTADELYGTKAVAPAKPATKQATNESANKPDSESKPNAEKKSVASAKATANSASKAPEKASTKKPAGKTVAGTTKKPASKTAAAKTVTKKPAAAGKPADKAAKKPATKTVKQVKKPVAKTAGTSKKEA